MVVGRAALAFWLSCAVLSGADGWVRYRGPQFEIWTDASRPSVQRVANAMQSARVFYENARGPLAGVPPPSLVRVVLFSSRREYLRVAPARSSEGFSRTGAGEDWIVMHAESSALHRVVMHEYTHVLTKQRFGELPDWLEEGLAEYYSTAEGESRAGFIQLAWAAPIPTHRRLLESQRRLGAVELLGGGDDDRNLFYAQSWALVHMLVEHEQYRDRFAAFLNAVRDQGDSAFAATFGVSFEKALDDLERYLARRGLAAHLERIPGAVPLMMIERDADVALPSLELRADLLWQAGRRSEAAKLFERVAQDENRPELAATARAYIALQQERPAEARLALEKAIAEGARSPVLLLQYAIVLRDLNAPAETVDAALAKAGEAGSAEAFFLLGVRRTDRGLLEDAVRVLERAASGLPDRADIWHALALAQQRSGASEKARVSARRAVVVAASPPERAMAVALLESLDEKPNETGLSKASATDREVTIPGNLGKTTVRTPMAWDNPQGDAKVEGVLKNVDCQDAQARLSIDTGAQTVTLSVADPARVVWRNAPGGNFQLACGAQKPVRVLVEFKQASGEITAIEFR